MSEVVRDSTVLLIDDDPETRDVLIARLEGAGFTVFAARGERDGVKYARVSTPHIILLEFGGRSPRASLALGRRVKEAAGLAAGVSLVVYAGREDGVAREGEAVRVALGEYVVLPEDGHSLIAMLRGLISSPMTLLLVNLLPLVILGT